MNQIIDTMANKYIKPVIDPAKFKANPLAGADFKIIVDRIADGNYYKDPDGTWLPSDYQREKESITKVYTKAEHRKMAMMLSPKAKSLFLWFIFEADWGNDYMWVNHRRYMEECNITSINTFKDAAEELSRYLIIYPSLVKEVYWINPALFFSGNRIAKYPDHVEISADLAMKRKTAAIVKQVMKQAV